MLKELLKRALENLLYCLGWFIDNIFLTILNFAICIPISYFIWIDGSYWSPIQRKVITDFSFAPIALRHNLILSSGSMLLVCIVFGCVCGNSGMDEKSSVSIAVSCALAMPTISFIIRFCIKAVKLYRLMKNDQ